MWIPRISSLSAVVPSTVLSAKIAQRLNTHVVGYNSVQNVAKVDKADLMKISATGLEVIRSDTGDYRSSACTYLSQSFG